MRGTVLLTMLLMGTLTIRTYAGEDYQILLSRPDKTGAKNKISATGDFSSSQKITAGGQLVKSSKEDYSVVLECIATVVKIDDMKRCVESSLEIEKLTKKDKATGKVTELLPKGTVVLGRKNGKKDEFTVKGNAVSPDTDKALGMFIHFPKTDVTDNDIFGTKEKKKVGDSWSVNVDRMAKDLTNEGIQTQAKDISGKTTLEKVVEIDGEKCLSVSAWMKVAKINIAGVPGMIVKSGVMKASFSGLFPVDPTKHARTEESKKDFSFEFEGKPNPKGPVANIKGFQKTSTKESFTPVK